MHEISALIVAGDVENQAGGHSCFSRRDEVDKRLRDLTEGCLPFGFLQRGERKTDQGIAASRKYSAAGGVNCPSGLVREIGRCLSQPRDLFIDVKVPSRKLGEPVLQPHRMPSSKVVLLTCFSRGWEQWIAQQRAQGATAFGCDFRVRGG